MNQPLCKAPFMSIRYSSEGYVGPCCWMNDFNYIRSNNTTPEQYWNNDKLKEVRKTLLEGELPTYCINCEKANDIVGTNRIDFFNKIYNNLKNPIDSFEVDQPFAPIQMDLNFSNICNLKCRHCGTHNSSAWYKDDMALNKVNNLDRWTGAESVNVNNIEFINRKEVFKNIRRLDFKGGEPLMQDEMYTLLKNLIKWNFAKDIELVYITNGTKDALHVKDLWSEFKKVSCFFSIEATGKLYEYIRGGNNFTFDNFNKNLIEYSKIESCTLGFLSSVMVYNMFNLPAILDYIKSVSNVVDIDLNTIHSFKNIVYRSAYLNYLILPKTLKEKLIDLYDKHDYVSLEPFKDSLIKNIDKQDPLNWSKFKKYTQELDKLRKTKLTDYVSEFEGFV